MRRSFLVGLAMILTAAPALAQSDAESKAAAEVMFREGKAAFDAGDFATACSKLESAVALTGGEALGGALFLGRCYERQGKTASAWAAYTEVAGKARAVSQIKRAEEAEAGAAALVPKLHYLMLEVPAEVAGLADVVIRKQGKALRRELWAARVPVDPGAIALEVSAPGKKTLVKSVQIPEAAGETKVTVEALADEAGAAASASVSATGSASAPAGASGTATGSAPRASGGATMVPVPTGSLPGDGASPWTGPRVGGVLIAGAGIVGLGVGIGLGATAKGQYDAAVSDGSNCVARPGGGVECADTGPASRARALGDVGTAVFFAGAAVTVGGALLFLLSPTPPKKTAMLPGVMVSPGGAALTWAGAF